MTGEAVRQLVEHEIGGDWSLTNWHGCNLRQCLVQPELREYDDCASGRSVQLWLVLEEDPEQRSGYKIVYSEEAGQFGLAIPGTTRDVLIGYYGTFLETYRAM